MEGAKTKSLRHIEEKMEGIPPDSLRYHVLECARQFKTSWIELGRSLYTVLKDKKFKEWGYSTFEAYTAKEIGIRTQTAMKLLRSYYFLEKEEPHYLKEEFTRSSEAAKIPGYESIDLLRQAKGKKGLDEKDYNHIKEEIFEKGRDVREVKKDLTALIRQRQELDPEEAWEKRKFSTVRRFLGTLKALKQEIEAGKFLPSPLIRQAAQLIKKLEEEVAQ